MRSRSSTTLRVVLALALATAALAPVSATPSEAATRRATAEPNAGLRRGDVVRVAWSGFTRTNPRTGLPTIEIVQCTAAPVSLIASCDLRPGYPSGNRIGGFFTQADGTGAANFEIANELLVGDFFVPTTRIPCDADNPCSIMVFEASNVNPNALPARRALIPMTMGRSGGVCPIREADVSFNGERSSSALVSVWNQQTCNAAEPLVLSQTLTNSREGRSAFLNGRTDVGITVRPPDAEELAEAAAAGKPDRSPVYAPLSAGAVVVVSQVYDLNTQRPITGITLTARLVARLVSASGHTAFFSDPEFLALNGSLGTFPSTMNYPLLRSGPSDDTWIVTNWLENDPAAKNLLDGKDPHVAVTAGFPTLRGYPTDTFQNIGNLGGFEQVDYNEVARRIFYRVSPTGGAPLPYNEGLFAVVDLPTALRMRLPIVRLVNAAGQAVGPEPANLEAGYAAMTRTAEGTFLPTPRATDPAAYPLVKIEHAMTAARYATPTKARAVGRMLTHSVGPGRDPAALPPGQRPLPSVMADEVRRIAAAVRGPDDPPPPTTTTTTTTAPTTTTVATSVTTTPPTTVAPGTGTSSTTVAMIPGTPAAPPTAPPTVLGATVAATTTTVADTTVTEPPPTTAAPPDAPTTAPPDDGSDLAAAPTVPALSSVSIEAGRSAVPVPAIRVVAGLAVGGGVVLRHGPTLRTRLRRPGAKA